MFILRAANGGIDQKFLYYAMLLSETQIKIVRRITGSAQPGLNTTFVDAVDILLPKDQREQRCIAEILSTVDEAIEQTGALIAKYECIKAGLMHDLFTRGLTPSGSLRFARTDALQLYKQSAVGWIPKEWKVNRLEDLTRSGSPICYGILQPGEHQHDGIPVVAIYNLNSDYELTRRCSLIIEANYLRSRIQGGDVLLSIKGSTGRVDIVPEGFAGNISRDVARLRPRAGLNARYLRYLLESASVQVELQRIVVGTTRQELSIGRLKEARVPIAEPYEQVSIVNRLACVDDRLRFENRSLAKLRMQKRGLMHDLLTARVRVEVAESAENAG